MKLLINIGALVGIDDSNAPFVAGEQMSKLHIIHDAWMKIRDGYITAYGKMAFLTATEQSLATEIHDMHGQWVFPSFCDSHTHIVYAGNRAGEFIDKINGLSYEEIAARGGGILNSADLLHHTSENDLFQQAMERVDEMIAKGTGAIEIKSGYGLTTADELKMLHVVRRIKQSTKIEIKSTFLGAHAVGREYVGRQDQYVNLICNEMIPAVGREQLADYVDVFCDKGFFTAEQTARILTTAAKWGMKPKIHANELDAHSGGVQVGVAHKAVSVDHLERTTDADIEALKQSTTIPTMLPGASFFLNMPYGNARNMIKAGLPLALASDYNPGSSPSGDMRFVAALACINMKLTPEQALNAATINGACAMELSHQMGSISIGKLANFYTTKPIPSLAFYLYAYTTPLIQQIWLRGAKLHD
jgi:imidazolonepropionase